MAEKEYFRLTRTKSRSAFGIVSTSRASLWLGQDHLLCIDSSGYTETYKRFYLRDIQALFLRETAVWKVRAMILATVAGVFALVAVLGGVIMAWIFGILAGLFLLPAIVDLVAGPTCVCHLRTAVQLEELPSLNRLRPARRVLGRLRPLLAAAQGQLAPEEIPARMQELLALSTAGTAGPASAPPYIMDEPNAPPRIIS